MVHSALGLTTALLIGLVGCSGVPRNVPEREAEPTGPVQVPSQGLDADLQRVSDFHATRPVLETPLADGLAVPDEVGSLSAESCGTCHPEHYAEWRVSTHAAAWSDRQFQAEIGKSGNRWLCLSCHTPLLVQHAQWPVGLVEGDVERPLLVDNPRFDAGLRDEGITCAACHVRGKAIHGPGRSQGAPHKVVADPDFGNEALCLRCHQAVATYPGKDFVCTFETGTEWRAGPYDEEGRGCVSCHMPETERAVAIGGPVRTVRQHWWRGAGIPKVEGVHPPLEANPPGLDLTARWAGSVLEIVATNARAGHMLPSGDPERWVQIDARFLDANGAAVGEPWRHRIGQEWTWYPVPEKRGDNRLAPREARTFSVAIPGSAVAAQVEASSHRMTDEAAAYHHLDDYPRSIRTHQLRVSETEASP